MVTSFSQRGGHDRAAGSAHIESRQAVTVGAYHDATTWMKLVAEYTNADVRWFNDAKQQANIVGAGMVVFW